MTQFQNSITLAKVKDGADGINDLPYTLRVNQNSINKYITKKGSKLGEENSPSLEHYECSPDIITFGIFNKKTNDFYKINKTDIAIYFIDSQGDFYTSYNSDKEQTAPLNLVSLLKLEENVLLKNYSINLTDFLNLEQNDTMTAEERDLQVFLRDYSGSFKIVVNFLSEGKRVDLNSNIVFEFGNSKETAQFDIGASKITQSIESTSLEFSKDGLLINDGQLVIQDNSRNASIYMDNGNITFSGTLRGATGDFTGSIYATDGEFKGIIRASQGDIGGFLIEKDNISSSDEERSLILNSNGSIIAKDITLGSNAKVENYIQLGRAFLRNPNYQENVETENPFRNVVLNVDKEIILKQDGSLKIGKFLFDGANSILSDIDNDWCINAQGEAFFKKINVGTLKISNSVLEISKVQTASGAMIFKEGSKVNRIFKTGQETNIELEDNKLILSVGDYVYLTCNNLKKISIITATSKKEGIPIYTLEDSLEGFSDKETILTKIVNGDKDFVISINSGKTTVDDPEFLHSHALAITTCTKKKTGLSLEKILVLGELSGLSKIDENIHGIGLYSQNVFLTGSLTTKIQDDSYAGLSTLQDCNATIFNGKVSTQDSSRIVFWAGAKSTAKEDVQHAPFQVTQNGSLYASQGLFKGAIVTEGIIEASELRAAKIYGYDTSTETRGPAALSIYDASKGITFYKTLINKETKLEDSFELFSIGMNGLQFIDSRKNVMKEPFIKIDSRLQQVSYNGKSITVYSEEADLTTSINLDNRGLRWYESSKEKKEEGTFLYLDKNITSLGSSDTTKITVDSHNINLYNDTTFIHESLGFKKNKDLKASFKIMPQGYDLYISE